VPHLVHYHTTSPEIGVVFRVLGARIRFWNPEFLTYSQSLAKNEGSNQSDITVYKLPRHFTQL